MMSKYNSILTFDSPNSLSEIIEMMEPNSKVLEFGPAYGRMTKYLKENLGCVVDIVEIDEEAGREASQYADTALIGHINGDIEKYIWLDKFINNKYDYIIFADVLEHLHNPYKVIEKCREILNDDGSILISLPNIAHNSILINLYFNKFKYTDLGLLDSTHIRFFALKDLETLYKQAGFSLVDFRILETTSQLTEQAEFFDPDYKKVEKLFNGREFGEAYQFILKLQKSEIAKRIEIPKDDLKRKYSIPVSLYLNTGNGYNPQEKVTKIVDVVDRIKVRFEINEGVKSLRFDPIEEHPCNVKVINIVTDAQIDNIQPLNSTNKYSEFGYYDEFLTLDPMYEITGNFENATYIEIDAEINLIRTIDYIDKSSSIIGEILYDNKALEGEIILSRKQLIERDELLNNTKNQLLEVQNQLLEVQNQLLEVQNQLLEAQNQLLEAQNQRLETQNELHQIRIQLNQVQKAYDEISNSFSWRMTKPFRYLADNIKKLTLGNLLYKGLKCFKDNGLKYTYQRIRKKIIGLKVNNMSAEGGKSCFVLPELTPEERERQTSAAFKNDIKFSIVVPMYNTPPKFLTELLDSVEGQTYQNWELCLADGSADNQNIAKIIKVRTDSDKRIKYIHLKENRGIAGNTQAAFELATGDYIVLMDHDDLLTEDALFETAKCIEAEPETDFIYSDRGIFDDSTGRLLAYHYLPAFSPDFLRACNYASHMNVFSRRIIDEVGFMRSGYDGSQDYDLELRTVEKARKIVNIEKVLYYCRACEGSVALNPESKMYAYAAGKKAIEEHIHRIGYPGKVEFLPKTFSYRIHYDIIRPGKTTIIIPNKDNSKALRACIDSILSKPVQDPYEIVIVENGSKESDTFMYYESIKENPKVRLLMYQNDEGEFNYSAINNYAVQHTDGIYILFLNNDTEVISDNWLTEMLMFAQREDVGAVGAKLYYSNDTYQHAGLFIGLGGHIASHYDYGKSRYDTGYMHRLTMPQNYNALTAACMMVKREDFLAVKGFDEVDFKVGLNDIDLCLKLRELGKVNVLTPYAELYHYESLSRGRDTFGANKARFEKEQEVFRRKWKKYFERHDIYCNPGIYQ